jgi:hypothetical protein
MTAESPEDYDPMTTIRRSICTLCMAVMLGVSALTISGCGDPAPPPMTPETFDAAKKEAEVIIQKEYGQKAFNKGQAAEKARSK